MPGGPERPPGNLRRTTKPAPGHEPKPQPRKPRGK